MHNQAPHSPDQAIASALRTLETERDGLTILMEAIGNGLGSYFHGRGRNAWLRPGAGSSSPGMGKSGHVGRKITATFASTGTPAHYVHPAEASHGDLGMIQTDDVIIALSWSGETAELADIIGYSRRFRVPLIALTSNAESTLGRAADICLTLPKAKEACPNGLAPTTSTTIQLALGDALAVALLEKRGFTAEHFRVFHPGGKLGARLKLVRDIMHIGRAPARSSASKPAWTRPSSEIGRKGFGAVIVVNPDGTLAGIVTDGDLRRNLTPDLVTLPVTAIMTKTPRTIAPDALVATALEMEEASRITALIVVENSRPVGLVHYLDLLRAGAA